MSRVVGPGKFAPAETQPIVLVSADVIQVDDGSEGWWAGVQYCFTAVAVATSVIVGSQAAQAQAVTTQDQGEIWTAVSRGGSGNVLPIFIEPSRGKFLQPWEFEQHDRASPPLDENPHQPPGPWPPEAKSLPLWQFEQNDIATQPLDESPYLPPAPWPPTTASPFTDDEVWAPPPPVPFFENYEWPLPPAWPATTARPALEADDFLFVEPEPPPPPLRVVEDQYQPPKPWGPGYILLPFVGSGSRIDQFQVGAIQVTESEYTPPQPWTVAPQPLYWFDTEFEPTAPAPIVVDEVGPSLTTWPRDAWVMLWLVDDAPPWLYEDEPYLPPAPWVVLANVPNPWWPDESRPTPPVALQVEPDPWPLPLPWAPTAHQAILGQPEEWPTFVEPQMVEPEPWPLPMPWPVPINAPLLGWQDELASIEALGGDASAVEPVLRAWPVPVPAQPIRGEDEKIVVPLIADIENELFPKVTPERRWVVPYPWEVEQHMLAFLSPHWPVQLRDYSGPRYIVDDASGTRYPITDDSGTRYEVDDT